MKLARFIITQVSASAQGPVVGRNIYDYPVIRLAIEYLRYNLYKSHDRHTIPDGDDREVNLISTSEP